MSSEAASTQANWATIEACERAVEHRQHGEWQEALKLLRELQSRVPDPSSLDALINDTQLRFEASQKWSSPGRRLIGPSRRALFVVALFLLLMALGLGVSAVYRRVVTPNLAELRVEQERARLAERAQAALASGDTKGALGLYDELATQVPDYPNLAEGRAKAQEGLALDVSYRQALDQIAAGQWADAQATLVSIQQVAPAYRDVATQLAKVERQQQLASLIYTANQGKAEGDLAGFIVRMEQARVLVQGQERKDIEAQLFDAYMARADELVAGSGGGVGELNQAVDLYGKALSLRPNAAEPSTKRTRISQYQLGYHAFTEGSWESAIAFLEPLYSAEPGFLDGQAAQLLYDAYVHSASALLDQGDTARAWERYNRASQITGVDTGGAHAVAASLAMLLTPTPTPTLTPTPTPEPTATLQPTATPTPRYVPLSAYRGKIAYFSDRGGKIELWIMDADGHNPFRPWQQDKLLEEYQQMRDLERRSPDGRASLVVTQPRGQDHVEIFIQQPDGKLTRITDWAGINYDPVWSPKGHWIAFVSNEPGNDEIFIIGDDGEHPKRLTWNGWEWDKHPSWAPEGGRLVFWSNRETGHGQIWLMNDDGSGQVNLSNNTYDETDPLWIK